MASSPILSSTFQSDSPSITGAVRICARQELEALRLFQDDASGEKKRKLIRIRLVGLLLLHWPNEEGRIKVAEEVTAAKEEEVDAIGQKYYDYLLRLFKSNKGPIPTPSAHISRPSFDRKAGLVQELLKEAPLNHATAKRKALVRDGFCCLLTGAIDTIMCLKTPELRMESLEMRKSNTHCAHIFSESTNAHISRDDGAKKEAYAVNAWTVIDRLGYSEILQQLNGADIHRLENVMTLSQDTHTDFDQLRLWLEATDVPHQYTLHSSMEGLLYGYPKVVTFTNHADVELPLPSPTYIQIHGACAKISHLSGAAEYIQTVLDDLEEIQVLAEDGTSADLLSHAIHAKRNSGVM